jgi:CrcB protein
LFLGVGILGGFTTFSSFSMEFWLLFERGQAWQAAAYVLASVVGGILACGLGLLLIRELPA